MPANATTTLAITDKAWSDDIAAGAALLVIQAKSAFPVLIQFGAAKPSIGDLAGFEIGPGETWVLGEPHFVAGHKAYVRSRLGAASVEISR